MKIAIVGPTHPYKGGIALHTTDLAHRLQAAGHSVEIVGWKHQYPFFYPGQQFVPANKPETTIFPASHRVLSWRNPFGWWKWGKQLRAYDLVVFVWYVPLIQGPIFSTMLRALGTKGPRRVFLCHNVVQHDAGPLDQRLTSIAFKRSDGFLTHTQAMANQIKALSTKPVAVAPIPSHPLGEGAVRKPANAPLTKHLLFFGLVRHYKGIDLLLQAMVSVPDVSLTVAGEIWGKQQATLDMLIEELGLQDRVTLTKRYVPAEELNELFLSADALVLPYRSGTATQNVDLAFAHGLPVIASTVGSMTEQVHDGIDGLLCPPGDVAALADAIKHFYSGKTATQLQKQVPIIDPEVQWSAYVKALTGEA